MSAPSAVAASVTGGVPASLSDLRIYQQRLIALVQREFRDGVRAVMMQLGTGGGKTHCAARGIVAPCAARGLRTLFLADLEELIDDTAGRLRALGLPVGIVKAGRPQDPEALVQVCSVQTLTRRMALADGLGALPPADRIVIDEARLCAAPTARPLLQRWPNALLLGLDATPSRGDGQPIDAFERIVCGPSIRWMQENTDPVTGLPYLVRARVFSPGRALERGVAEDPVQTYLRRAAGGRAVIFVPTAPEAERVARDLSAAGYPTLAVLSGMPGDARKRVRDHMRAGELTNLVTCRALLKGFDLPLLDTAIIAQAQHSVADWLQAVGRVLRPAPGKDGAVVHDLRGASVLHGLPEDDRVWDLTGTSGRRTEDVVRAGLRRCAECHAVYAPAARCPVCGCVRSVDTRPLAIQRAEMREMSDIPAHIRAEQTIARAVDAIRRRKPKLTAAQARFAAMKKAPSWVREALASAPSAAPSAAAAVGAEHCTESQRVDALASSTRNADRPSTPAHADARQPSLFEERGS